MRDVDGGGVGEGRMSPTGGGRWHNRRRKGPNRRRKGPNRRRKGHVTQNHTYE